MNEPLIDSQAVMNALSDSFYLDEEIAALPKDEMGAPVGAVIVEGVLGPMGFHPERLETHREEITGWLQALPVLFRSAELGGGGGWSFLNVCQDRNDVQWTGLHMAMNALLCMGIGLDLCAWVMPRDFWHVFPGGMPYVVVNV